MKKFLWLILPFPAMAQNVADSNNWFRINTNFVENPATVGENGKRVVTMAWGYGPVFPEYLSYYLNHNPDPFKKIGQSALSFLPNNTINFQTPLANNKHGLGLAINSQFDSKVSIQTNFMISYAYKVFEDKRGQFQVGMNAGLVRKEIDYYKLSFGDMIGKGYGFIYPSSEPLHNYSHVTRFNMNLGVFWKKKNWYAGSNLHNMPQPNLSHFDRLAPLYRVWQNDVGYLSHINSRWKLTFMLHIETNRYYTLLKPSVKILFKDRWYANFGASPQQLYLLRLGQYRYNGWRWYVQVDRNGLSGVSPKNRVSINLSKAFQKLKK